MVNFYNTIRLTGSDLDQANQKAATQEMRITMLFKQHKSLSPSDIESLLKIRRGSLSRALTNLTKAGVLEKTDYLKPSPYGSREHVWRIVENASQQKIPF